MLLDDLSVIASMCAGSWMGSPGEGDKGEVTGGVSGADKSGATLAFKSRSGEASLLYDSCVDTRCRKASDIVQTVKKTFVHNEVSPPCRRDLEWVSKQQQSKPPPSWCSLAQPTADRR